MKGFKQPSFQDRATASAQAKKDALEKLKAAPKRDEAEIAARIERQRQKEEAAAAKRAAIREAKEEAERAEREKVLQAEAERTAAEEALKASMPTQAELKARRDARYAARKARK